MKPFNNKKKIPPIIAKAFLRRKSKNEEMKLHAILKKQIGQIKNVESRIPLLLPKSVFPIVINAKRTNAGKKPITSASAGDFFFGGSDG